MPEFAFDIQIRAVARVEADNETSARVALDEVLDAVDLQFCQCTLSANVRLTEASLAHEPEEAHLIEDDGLDVIAAE